MNFALNEAEEGMESCDDAVPTARAWLEKRVSLKEDGGKAAEAVLAQHVGRYAQTLAEGQAALQRQFSEREMQLNLELLEPSSLEGAVISGPALAGALLERHGVDIDEAEALKTSPIPSARDLHALAVKLSRLTRDATFALVDIGERYWRMHPEGDCLRQQLQGLGLELADASADD